MKKLLLSLIFICSTFLINAQEISPYLVGSNYWYQLDQKPEVMSIIAESGMKTIRIGGNGYNKNMPDNATLEQWVNQIKGMGMEPIMQVSAFASAADAASVVQYFNVDTDNPIKLWAIGNEPALHQDFTAEEVYDYAVEYATAMKEIDPSIIIFVPDLAWVNFQYLDRLIGGNLDLTGLKLAGTDTYIIDGFTWHRYPLVGDPYVREDAVNVVDEDLREPAARMVDLMETADAMHGRTGEDKLKWGIGEFNINVGMSYGSNELFRTVEGIGTNSFLNGQFFAEVFDMSMALGAHFATSWSIHESGGERGPGDLGLINGTDSDPNPRSNFYHSIMVAENIYGAYLKVAADQNLVSAFGSIHPDNTIAVMVLNKEEEQGFDFSIHFDEGAVADDNPLQLIADLGMDVSFVGFMPPQATMVLTFSETGELTEKIIYTLAHAQGFVAPAVLGADEDTTIVNISKDVEIGCTDSPVDFSAYTTLPSDSVLWSFGEGASPETSKGLSSGAVTYDTEGAKTVQVLVYKDGESQTFTFEDFITINPCTQSPYQGNKQEIPGTIESVYYDEGGQDVAYYDTDPENKDNGIRPEEGVDTGLGDIENGAGNIGWLEAGEWLEYTIDIKETSAYQLSIRHASLVGGGQFKLLFDGTDKTGLITTPATTGWFDFEEMMVQNIALEAGESIVMRLEIVTGAVNLGTFTFEQQDIINAVDGAEDKKTINIYPNPASGRLFVRTRSMDSVTYEVLSLTGKRFMKGNLNSAAYGISVNDLVGGLYIIRFISKQEQVSKLFFKD